MRNGTMVATVLIVLSMPGQTIAESSKQLSGKQNMESQKHYQILAQAGTPLRYCLRDCENRVSRCEQRCSSSSNREVMNEITRPKVFTPGQGPYDSYSTNNTARMWGNLSECREECSSKKDQCEFDCDAQYNQ
jgi:hypothetical protein